MPGIPTFSAESALALPETSAAFWKYISSPLFSRSLQTILSASNANTTRRYTVSSLLTCFAQFQHVLGSILSSSDSESIEYFDRFLEEDLNMTNAKLEDRSKTMKQSLRHCLTSVIDEHDNLCDERKTLGRYIHPAVREARDLLLEMEADDRREEVKMFQRGIIRRRTTGTPFDPSILSFLENEEHILRLEFLAFKRDRVGPNGRREDMSPRMFCPPTIQALRVYHDGGLSVDSRHAFNPTSRPASLLSRYSMSTFTPSVSKDSTPSSTTRSSMSLLEKQFFEAISPPVSASNRTSYIKASEKATNRRSIADLPDLDLTLLAQHTQEVYTPRTRRKFWYGDWESEDEDEFYREALRYDLSP